MGVTKAAIKELEDATSALWGAMRDIREYRAAPAWKQREQAPDLARAQAQATEAFLCRRSHGGLCGGRSEVDHAAPTLCRKQAGRLYDASTRSTEARPTLRRLAIAVAV